MHFIRRLALPGSAKAALGGLQTKEPNMNRVPTIQELLRKPPSELHAIFQKATLAAAETNNSAEEQAAAKLLLARIAICHKVYKPAGP